MKSLICTVILLLSLTVSAQKISVSGRWEFSLDSNEISDAGNDYNKSYLSNTNQSKITYSSYPKSNYRDRNSYFDVYVHKEDINWSPELKLEIKRTSVGTSRNPQVYQGTNFIEISNNLFDPDSYNPNNYQTINFFFYSIGKVKNINVQYKISGLSVLLPVDNYSTEIVYTVMSE